MYQGEKSIAICPVGIMLDGRDKDGRKWEGLRNKEMEEGFYFQEVKEANNVGYYRAICKTYKEGNRVGRRKDNSKN